MTMIDLSDETIRQARAGAARAGGPVEDWIGLAVRTLTVLQLGELPAGRMNPLARPLKNTRPAIPEGDGPFSNEAAVETLRPWYGPDGRLRVPPGHEDPKPAARVSRENFRAVAERLADPAMTDEERAQEILKLFPPE